MDWFLDTRDEHATRELRRQVASYLARHAESGGDLHAAELAVAEVLANAMEHAGGPVWVTVDWRGLSPELSVRDLGHGFVLHTDPPADLLAEGGRGLFLVSHLTSKLEVAARRAGGTTVTAQLPVRRPAERSYDPPVSRVDALPTAEEADSTGLFDRESFLRALVVQLAQSVEFNEGPDAAEAAVAQVGADVGGRMEEEYRQARGIVDALDPDEMAQLYVALKARIGGDFYVIEANEDRIVLGNRACPFGSVVRRAPALCRMTSSVFGGVAARNTGGATVQLEERIALGDPECRVVVWLRDPTDENRHGGHYYSSGS